MAAILDRIMRAGEGRILKELSKTVVKVNSFEAATVALTDEELRAKTDEFKARYTSGESLDDLLPEAFAAVREASKRTLGQRHYDVQLMGGAAMHLGNIAWEELSMGMSSDYLLAAELGSTLVRVGSAIYGARE